MPVFSTGKPWRPRRKCFAVLGKRQQAIFSGFGGKPPDLRRLTQKTRSLIVRADARLLNWETLAPPARVFCGAREEGGRTAEFGRFWSHTV